MLYTLYYWQLYTIDTYIGALNAALGQQQAASHDAGGVSALEKLLGFQRREKLLVVYVGKAMICNLRS